MEKDVAARYQSAAEMGADLELILAGLPQRNMSIFLMEEAKPGLIAAWAGAAARAD